MNNPEATQPSRAVMNQRRCKCQCHQNNLKEPRPMDEAFACGICYSTNHTKKGPENE